MNKEEYTDKDTLERLYWEEDLSLPSIAERLGCSETTVYRYMVKHDIPRRSVSKAEKLTFEQGRKGWNKGKYLSPQHRRKISEALKGRTLPEETKRKISQAKKGKKLSEEARRNIIQALRSRPKTGVYKKCKHCGKRFYVEPHRKDVAQFCSCRCNIIHNKLGEKSRPKMTPKLRERLRKMTIKGLLSQNRGRSNLEKLLKDEFEQREMDYEEQVALYHITVADFVFSEARVVVYADGDYWHKRPDIKERDAHQNEVLTQKGWTVLRFWGHEIKENVEACVDKIQQTMEDVK